MKFTLSWLKEHLDTDEPVEKLADKLTMIGLEVENIEDKAKALAPFTIARVISAEQHPNADRLRVCMVETGNGSPPVQVVCGAPNARAGLVSVFSAPGTYIPGKDIMLGLGRRHGQVQRPCDQAIQGRVSLSRASDSRGPNTVSRFCLAAGARRQQRSLAGLAAKALELDRLAADQRAGRHHELHDVRPRSA